MHTGVYDLTVGDTVLESNVPFNTIRTDLASFTADETETQVSKLTSFSGSYSPKNNKCYVYPYNYLLATNNAGSQNIYKYEMFSDSVCRFSVQLALSIGCSGRSVPLNYKGLAENIDESLPLAKYPTCSWVSDAYTNWLTQNSVNIKKDVVNVGFTTARGMGSVIGNALIGNVFGAIGSTVDMAQNLTNQIMDIEGNFHKASLLPEITGGSSDGDVNFASLDIGFKYCRMRVKDEYLRIIDNFFTRFGYKTVRVKIPNIVSRRYWNYLQIGSGESMCYGDIPQDALSQINQIAQKRCYSLA